MKLRRVLGAAAIVAGSLIFGSGIASGTGSPPPNTNEVAYWCPGGGVKYDALSSTSFTVPAPPEGKVWTLLVLKTGSDQSVENENETFSNPVVGQSYSHSSGKILSHAILCYSTTTTTTGATTTAATTTLATTTTGATTTLATTTVPTTIATTTTAPTTTQGTTTTIATTTTGNVGICCLEGTTTVASTTSTTAAATTVPATTVAPTTTAAPVTTAAIVTAAPVATPTELPHTGSMTGPEVALGLGFLVTGGLALVGSRRRTA